MVNFLRFRKNKVDINSCTFYSKEEVMGKIEQLRKFWSDVPNNSYKDIFEMRVRIINYNTKEEVMRNVDWVSCRLEEMEEKAGLNASRPDEFVFDPRVSAEDELRMDDAYCGSISHRMLQRVLNNF